MLNPESPSTAPALIDPASKAFQSLLDKLAPTEATVLIVGETGTGKEVVARYLHHHSARRQQPFLAVNCGALTESLAEAELFGHEKGAFTGAARKGRIGRFQLASGGSIFLDEVNLLTATMQPKFLRVLQEMEIDPVGGEKSIPIDVRVIAATNKNLRDEITKGNFREDLYHRIGVIVVRVPALRDHAQDVPLLADHFIRTICAEYGIPPKRIESNALRELQAMRWSGNIRELRNVIERLIILSEERITLDDVKTYC